MRVHVTCKCVLISIIKNPRIKRGLFVLPNCALYSFDNGRNTLTQADTHGSKTRLNYFRW